MHNFRQAARFYIVYMYNVCILYSNVSMKKKVELFQNTQLNS